MGSRKKYREPSAAQTVFKDKVILTERPAEMNFEEYKILQRIQRDVLKILFKKGTGQGQPRRKRKVKAKLFLNGKKDNKAAEG